MNKPNVNFSVSELANKVVVILVVVGFALGGAKLLGWINLQETLQNAIGYLLLVAGLYKLVTSLK